MELINYLNEHFLAKQALLDVTKITAQQLVQYQEQGVMPKPSYKLKLNVQSDSFFGIYEEEQFIEYYGKGYSAWLATIQSISSTQVAYETFEKRYKTAIDELATQGFMSNNPKVHLGLSQHIKEEWQHFLNGIYGLCTRTGLPEDIAAKELSILIISELSEIENLSTEQLAQLTKAVNLLDQSSALFAPHERKQSSRFRLVDEMRRKYMLHAS